MTHNDIYTKFMIEYDKANVTSSYPSLTEYEVATVLDKAYNALIAQKVTGNNVRRSSVESDIKSIADLGPLTKSTYVAIKKLGDNEFAPNVSKVKVPSDLLYFLLASMMYNDNSAWTAFDNKDKEGGYKYNPVDGYKVRSSLVKLVNHETALRFFGSSSNIPWIKQPVCFIENMDIYVVYDPLNPPIINNADEVTLSRSSADEECANELKFYNINPSVISAINYTLRREDLTLVNYETLKGFFPEDVIEEILQYSEVKIGLSETSSDNIMQWFKFKSDKSFRITYIKKPKVFAKELGVTPGTEGTASWFSYDKTKYPNAAPDSYLFECNNTVAEELVSLAVAFALENVESPRLNSKLNMRGLEA